VNVDPQWYGGQLERKRAAPRKSWSTNWTRLDKICDQAKHLQEKTEKELVELQATKKALNHATLDSETRQSLDAHQKRSGSKTNTADDTQRSAGSLAEQKSSSAPSSCVLVPSGSQQSVVASEVSVSHKASSLGKPDKPDVTAPLPPPQRVEKKVPGAPTLLNNVYEPAKTVSKSGRVGLRGVKAVSDVKLFSQQIAPYSRKEADARAAFKNHRLNQCQPLHTSACTWDALQCWKASEMPFHAWAHNAEKGKKYFYEWNSP